MMKTALDTTALDRVTALIYDDDVTVYIPTLTEINVKILYFCFQYEYIKVSVHSVCKLHLSCITK